MTYYKTTEYRQATDHRQPTTNPTTSAPPTHRPTTERHVLHRPTEHLPLTSDSATGSPPTHWSPTHRLIDPLTNLLIHKTYFNRVTMRSILSIINFNSSFGMGTIYYWIRRIIYKMIGKKERWWITKFVDPLLVHSIWKPIFQNINIEWENWKGISFFKIFSLDIFIFISLVLKTFFISLY